MDRGIDLGVNLYSSYDSDMPQNFSNENWDKINYLINHKPNNNRSAIQEAIWYYIDSLTYPSDPNVQAIINDTEENGEGFVPQPGDTIAILAEGNTGIIQRSFFELTIPEIPTEEPEPEPEPTRNHAPTADATAGQPYIGLIGQEIIFDGSRSYDIDGSITSYYWDFGDQNNGSGVVASHIYQLAGTYTVRLTVTDDDGLPNTHTVSSTITLQNTPPGAPILSGPNSGHKNVLYSYTAVSTDSENDLLQYIFNWGDGKTSNTEFISDIAVQSHSWDAAGQYVITVKAFDNAEDSGVITLTVLIDSIYVGDKGYLIDLNGDGLYDSFYSNETGTETQTEISNEKYLIDADGDGDNDYEFNPVTNGYNMISGETSNPGILSNTMLIAVGILVVAIILLVIYFIIIKKKK